MDRADALAVHPDLARAAVDMLETDGSTRICIASACDWGPSDPVAVPKFALEMRRRGHDQGSSHEIIFENPKRFLGQSPKFKLPAERSERVAEAALL